MHRQFQRVKQNDLYTALPQTDGDELLDSAEASSEEGAEPNPNKPATWRRRWRKYYPDVEGDNFNIAVGAVIVVNAAVLGLETDFGQDDFLAFEHFFGVFFTMEMTMRLLQLGIGGYFRQMSNCFDCLLVCTGDFDLWITPFLVSANDSSAGSSSGARIMKLLRMFRVMRIVRLFKMFRQLKIILEAFIKALSTVCWVGLLTLIFNYVCAVFLTQTIGHNSDMWDAENAPKVAEWFGTVGHSMRTLFIILTLAQWDEIALTISDELNGMLVFSCAIGYITITAFTMVSLITGIISEELVGSQKDDEEFKLSQIEKGKKELFTSVRALLEKCDEDGGGTLSSDEINKALANPELKLITKLNTFEIAMEMDDFLSLIEKLKIACDSDEVPIDDVAHALEHLSGHATSSSVWDLKMITLMGQKQANAELVKVSKKIEALDESAQQDRALTKDYFENILRRVEQMEQNLQRDGLYKVAELDQLKLKSSQASDKLDKIMVATAQSLHHQSKMKEDCAQTSEKLGKLVGTTTQVVLQQTKLQDVTSEAKQRLEKLIEQASQLIDQPAKLQLHDDMQANDKLDKLLDLTTQLDQHTKIQDDNSQTNGKLDKLMDRTIQLLDQQGKLQDEIQSMTPRISDTVMSQLEARDAKISSCELLPSQARDKKISSCELLPSPQRACR